MSRLAFLEESKVWSPSNLELAYQELVLTQQAGKSAHEAADCPAFRARFSVSIESWVSSGL